MSQASHENAGDPAALVRRAADGDQAAWAQLVGAYTDRVFGLLLSRCHDRDLAEELTQVTFAKVVTHLSKADGYQEQGRFEAWLFRIAINALRDEARRRKRQTVGQGGQDDQGPAAWERVATDAPDPLERLTQAERVDQLRQAVATMSEADQQILHLRHTAGLSFAQIARTLDQPLGTVLARGHRALAKLRKMLDDRDAQPR